MFIGSILGFIGSKYNFIGSGIVFIGSERSFIGSAFVLPGGMWMLLKVNCFLQIMKKLYKCVHGDWLEVRF